MPKIEMRTQDFRIKTITDKDGKEVEVIQLKDAFDEDLIKEMRSFGVKDMPIYEEEEEEEEETK